MQPIWYFWEVWVPKHTFTTRSNLQTSHSFFKPQSNSCPQITRGSWADQQGSVPVVYYATPESLLSSQHGKKKRFYMPQTTWSFCIVEMHQDWIWLPGIQCGDEFMLLGWKIVWSDNTSPSLPRSEVGGPQAFKSLHSFWVYSCNEEAALSH